MGVYVESARRMINPMDIPTFMIECAKAENALFEGLIELNFAEVYRENGLAVFTEEETAAADAAGKEATDKTIGAIIEKFKAALKTAFQNITDKLKEFFNKTASLVSSKVIENPEAAKCKTEDIWFADYQKQMDERINVDKIKGILDKLEADAANSEDASLKLKDFMDVIDKAFEEVPTSVEEFNAGKKVISPVPLFTRASKYGDLQKALSVGGLGSNIKKVFETLNADVKVKVESTDDEQTADSKKKAIVASTKARLAFFSAETKVVVNTCAIARRNYSAIATWVKNGGKETEGQTKESTLYMSYSDMVCESVFGF